MENTSRVALESAHCSTADMVFQVKKDACPTKNLLDRQEVFGVGLFFSS
jgi:hypothetical protein